MKIALITPCYYPFVRGNAVTVRRIERNLVSRGCEVEVFSLDTVTAEDALKKIRSFNPDILHAFHAYFGGRTARLIAESLGKPYIITLTGTDVYEALQDARSEETILSLKAASSVVAFHANIVSRLVEGLPELAGKTCVISQGVEIPGSCYFHHDEFRPEEAEKVILLPAGIRPVKNVAFALPLLARLHDQGARLYFVLIGPILNRGYASEVLAELEKCAFAHYFGEVGHHAIGWFYEHADIVLNTSSFEGGMANSVLEAMAFGKAVLASNIEGNRSVIMDGVTGLLYHGEAEFSDKLEKLMEDEALRKKLGDNARDLVVNNFPLEKEAASYVNLYEKILGRSACS